MAQSKRYTDNADVLIALISYLAATRKKSRRPKKIAEDLGLDRAEVTLVLHTFKSLFRESHRFHEKSKEHYYTLYLRYALRSQAKAAKEQADEEADDNEIARQPLSDAQIAMLFEFVARMVEQERTAEISRQTNQVAVRSSKRAAGAAIFSALCAGVVAIGVVYISLSDG